MVALSALEAAATGGTRCFGAASVQAGDSSLPCRRPILLTHRHLGDVVPHCPRMTAFGRYEDGDDPASFRQACPLLASSNLCTGGISVSILARLMVGEGGGKFRSNSRTCNLRLNSVGSTRAHSPRLQPHCTCGPWASSRQRVPLLCHGCRHPHPVPEAVEPDLSSLQGVGTAVAHTLGWRMGCARKHARTRNVPTTAGAVIQPELAYAAFVLRVRQRSCKAM